MLKLPLFGAAGGPFILNLLGVPAGAAFGVRKLNGAYTGAALNVRRSSDNATLDIGFLPNGSLNASAFSGFISGGSGFVTKWYDQSGNGRDASQSTAASQPQLVLSAIGGRPALQFSGAQYLLTSSFASSTSAQTINAVAERSANFTTAQWLLTSGGFKNSFGWTTSTNTLVLSGTSNVNATASDNAFHSLTGVINGASSVIQVDGTQTGVSVSGSASSGVISIGASNTGGGPLSGDVAEVFDWSSALSAAQIAAVHSSQSTYYGTS